MNLGAGWLAASPEVTYAVYADVTVPRVSAGTPHDPPGAVFSTRIEEYGHIVQHMQDAPRGAVFSAGAGFNPEIHVLEYILGNLGFDVLALDCDLRARDMPPHPRVLRFQGDLVCPPFPSASYAYWVCVSVLEHIGEWQLPALNEAYRLLAPGGFALLTIDETPPERMNAILGYVGFDVGPVEAFSGTHLSPRVSWAIARKAA